MAEPESVRLPAFVTAKWVAENLRISDAEAEQIGQGLAAAGDNSWDVAKDRASFAEQFLERFADDPGIASDCRRVLGRKPPPIFAPPKDKDVDPLPEGATARQCLGHYAACGRAAAERGDAKGAMRFAMLELLEYGGVADEAFKLAHDVQHLDKYRAYADAAASVQRRGYMLALLGDGLSEAEAEAEARSIVGQELSFGRLAAVAAAVNDSEDPIATLSEAAEVLAEAARNAAAYVQISTAPLGTDSAVATLRESVAIVEAHLEGSEDAELFKQADQAKELADGCKVQLVDRELACSMRQQASAIRDKALEASSAADDAASIPIKSLADAKKAAAAFEGANKLAKDTCREAIACAKAIQQAKPLQSNEDTTKRLFGRIEAAFRGAQAGASEEAKKTAAAAAAAQEAAQAASRKLELEAADAVAQKRKESQQEPPPEPAQPAAEPAGADAAGARDALLAELKKFGSKRWDTNMATQTLARLCDRRKEVIGQLWEAVEKDEGDALSRSEKFIEQFRNTMDARRRLDAVVRLMGRGQQMDPRTAKWFTDQIIEISKAAAAYVKAAS